MRIFLFILTFGIYTFTSAQITIDSTLKRVEKIRYSHSDSAMKLIGNVKNKELNTIQQCKINELTGDIMWYKGDFDASVEAYQLNVEIFQDQDSIRFLGHTLADIGYVYMEMKRYSDALEQYQRAFEIAKQFNDENLIYLTTTYKGQLNQSLGNPEKALESYQEALSSDIKMNNERNMAIIYNNMAGVYIHLAQYENALTSSEKSWETWQRLDDKNGLANYHTSKGISLRYLGRLDEALENLLEAEKLNRELGKKIFLADSYVALVDVYMLKQNPEKAREYLNKTKSVIQESPNINLVGDYYDAMSTYYKSIQQWDSAYYYVIEFMQVKDSILDIKKQEQTTLLSAEFDSDKKEYDIKLLKAEHERDQLMIEQRNKQLYFTIGGGLIFLILSIIAYRSYKQKEEANYTISEQNEELNQQNEELAAQRDEIERQKHIVEEAHTEIQDSIVYAKRIQKAILPPDQLVEKYFAESFVLYRPKDVVAGDFYWLETISAPVAKAVNADQSTDLILFAVADCTGHGVPGAMMSVVCHNALNRSVREFQLTDPGKILDKTREIVLHELSRSDHDVKDGMDIALCSLEWQEGSWKLQYAGAYNPLWIIRDARRESDSHTNPSEPVDCHSEPVDCHSEPVELLDNPNTSPSLQTKDNKCMLLELKADRQPIGNVENPMPFTTHSITLLPNDTIYLFSDGYSDQFGGERDRKFGTNQFKELLLSLSDLPMQEQKNRLTDAFVNWMNQGNGEQLDDVCMIGVKMN